MKKFALHKLTVIGRVGLLALYVMTFAVPSAQAQISLIRDAEAEAYIRSNARPIFAAAGLNPNAVNIHLVNSGAVNAFVAGGQRLFVHTGMITAAPSPSALLGVIAHETGHIAGGHLSRTQEALSGATIPLILSTVLGIAAIAAGEPDAGMAVIAGGQHIAERTFLSYSRVQESAADQAAVGYLNATGQSARGLTEMFNQFADQEILTSRQQDPYARSHPMSRQRVSALRERVEASPYVEIKDTPAQIFQLNMIQAKIYGFLERPEVTFLRYPQHDKSLPARYARAVAYYLYPDTPRALQEIDSLLRDDPNNPYFHELKGQIFLNAGRPAEAIMPYRESVRLAPDQPLLKVNLAQAMLATEAPLFLDDSINLLKASVQDDNDNTFAYHQLAMAYARKGEEGMAELYTAERFFMAGATPRAGQHAARAAKALPQNTPHWLRAIDILHEAKKVMDEKRGKS